jgi:hypothetical protein
MATASVGGMISSIFIAEVSYLRCCKWSYNFGFDVTPSCSGILEDMWIKMDGISE